MEIIIDGKPAEDLKLPISSLGLPGRQEHLSLSKGLSRIGCVDRNPDEHGSRVSKDGSNGPNHELYLSRNTGNQELRTSATSANHELISSRLNGSGNGPPPSDQPYSGSFIGAKNNTPSPHNDRCAQEQNIDTKLRQEEVPYSDEREITHRQGNWAYGEILVLLEAKAKEYMHAFGDSRRTRLSADDKWKNVSDYCRSKGVQRTKEQCRVKWDNMMPDYRKVRDYEEQKEPNAPSYFEMDVWERRMKLLPSNMDAEIYLRIASIQTSKPPKGGLKREAREKRSLEYSHMLATSLQSLGHLSNGFESINGIDYGGERPLADHVGQHIASSTPKRRRRRRAADFAFPIERKPEALNRIDLGVEPVARADVEIHDSSSTEDDAAVVNSRSQQGTPSTACLYAERSSFILSQGTNHESRDVLPVAYRSQNTIQQAGSVAVERGNNVVFGGSAARGTCLKETANGTSNHDATNHGEDRKDARHRELMELEREKLAVFREATCAIANAMTNAMAVFSKVAEELLLRRR